MNDDDDFDVDLTAEDEEEGEEGEERRGEGGDHASPPRSNAVTSTTATATRSEDAAAGVASSYFFSSTEGVADESSGSSPQHPQQGSHAPHGDNQGGEKTKKRQKPEPRAVVGVASILEEVPSNVPHAIALNRARQRVIDAAKKDGLAPEVALQGWKLELREFKSKNTTETVFLDPYGRRIRTKAKFFEAVRAYQRGELAPPPQSKAARQSNATAASATSTEHSTSFTSSSSNAPSPAKKKMRASLSKPNSSSSSSSLAEAGEASAPAATIGKNLPILRRCDSDDVFHYKPKPVESVRCDPPEMILEKTDGEDNDAPSSRGNNNGVGHEVFELVDVKGGEDMQNVRVYVYDLQGEAANPAAIDEEESGGSSSQPERYIPRLQWKM